MTTRHRIRIVICLVVAALVAGKPRIVSASDAQAARAAALKIVALEGEGAVNIIQQKTAVAPVVEVRDRNDQPVSGAVVRFAIQKGKASFNGARTLTATTDAPGRATATGLTPTGSGALQIGTTAAFQGQTAAISIAQTIVLTAAQASAVTAGGSGAAGGGGLSHTALAAILGGAGVAGGLVATRTSDAQPAAQPQVQAFSPAGTWSFAITANVPLTQAFGSCVAQSSATTVVGGDGAYSIPFAGLTCGNCSMSGTITGTVLNQTSVAGSVTASISGSGCSIQQPSPTQMSGTCSAQGTATRCNVSGPVTSGFSYTLTRP